MKVILWAMIFFSNLYLNKFSLLIWKVLESSCGKHYSLVILFLKLLEFVVIPVSSNSVVSWCVAWRKTYFLWSWMTIVLLYRINRVCWNNFYPFYTALATVNCGWLLSVCYETKPKITWGCFASGMVRQ